MASITVTITDVTKGPFQVSALFSGSQPGASVLPAVPNAIPHRARAVTYQASSQNGGAIVYHGDNKIRNDGTTQGAELPAGASETVALNSWADQQLQNEYIWPSANGAMVNIEVE
jgi:hypothetical protein